MDLKNASFRDPSGHVFVENGIVFRSVNYSYKRHYERLNQSGLYDRLTSRKLLIAHEELEKSDERAEHAFKILKPEQIRYITYPYEWSFSQLKDAGICLLEVQKASLDCGLTLKDATPLNIQFQNGEPLLIDTLSFEERVGWHPWVAYRQFCETILAPLALAAYCDPRLIRMLRLFLGGIPLELCVSQLPFMAWLNPGLLLHLFLHQKFQKKHADSHIQKEKQKEQSKQSIYGLLESLQRTVSKLKLSSRHSVWSEYYEIDVETDYFQEKKQIINSWISLTEPSDVWDLGANTGEFSRLFSSRKIPVLAFDLDCLCVEKNYLRAKKEHDGFLVPLCLDLMNPSPACGWSLSERMSWVERGKPDLVVCLAIIHHLALGQNVPLANIARFFAGFARKLIIEFVPKDDANAQRVMANKGDIFPDYCLMNFKNEFGNYFDIEREKNIAHSLRTLLLMKRKC